MSQNKFHLMIDSASGIRILEIQQFSDFSANIPRKLITVRFAPSSKVLWQIRKAPKTAELLKLAYHLTENSIKKSIKE